MNVKIISMTEKPMDVTYKAFRICYSKDVPTEIKVPQRDFYPEGATTPLCTISDNKKITEFIKDKIDKGHESPLEHCNITFAIEGVSRALSHQLVRHRIASYSQQSQRYVRGDDFEFVVPDSIKNNFEPMALDIYTKALEVCKRAYKALVSACDVPKEDARYIFPNATTTNLVMTMNLRTFRNFIAERTCKNAQWEIRELANKMLEEVEKIVPFVGYKAKKCGISCFECKVK